MSFQSAIPWQVALRQSLPPLHRLERFSTTHAAVQWFFSKRQQPP